jgi:hypothetical protein
VCARQRVSGVGLHVLAWEYEEGCGKARSRFCADFMSVCRDKMVGEVMQVSFAAQRQGWEL